MYDGTDTHILKAVQEPGLGGRYTIGLDETANTVDWGVAGSSVGLDADAGDIVLRDVADTTGTDAGVAVAPWSAGDDVVVYLVYNQENSEKIPEIQAYY